MSWSLVPRDCPLSIANTLANRIQEYLRFTKKQVVYSTYLSIQFTLEEFEIFTGQRDLDRKLMIDWDENISKKGNRASTINKKNGQVKKFLKWCEDQQFLDSSPGRFLPHHKEQPQPLPAIYTEEEYERIKEATFGTDLYFLSVVAYRTGMSLIDCCHLRWSSIDMDNLMIEAARIKMLRHGPAAVFWVPILANGDLHNLLVPLKEAHTVKYNNNNDDYVNPELPGRYHYHCGFLATDYKNMLAKVGITGKSFKNFRNTFISNLANSGMNLGLACKMSGHKDPSIFAHYIRPDPEALRNGLQAAFQWATGKQTVKELRRPNHKSI